MSHLEGRGVREEAACRDQGEERQEVAESRWLGLLTNNLEAGGDDEEE